MPERKVQVPYLGRMVDGMDVPISASSELWSELTLGDGTVLRVKQSVATVVRINEYDRDGNPIYVVRSAPTIVLVQVPENLRQKPATQH